MEWQQFWTELLITKKLTSKVEELNVIDASKGQFAQTEKICHNIYDDYETWHEQLVLTKKDFLQEVEQIEGIHLQSSRIKTKESLIVKVITKRYENVSSRTSSYAYINGDNYREIITDLIGMRLIINYRGKWEDIHWSILEHFPQKQVDIYKENSLLKHEIDEKFQAEIPKVYYAANDKIETYQKCGLETKAHKAGYRSIHYTISYKMTYIEVQVRTIYDEAWSDCDHNYVYKHEANPSNRALSQLTKILCSVTNTASDIGETMREIYEGGWLLASDNEKWIATNECKESFDNSIERLEVAVKSLKEFQNNFIY